MKKTWNILDPSGYERIGLLPQIISQDDPRPVVEQVNDRYAHGGGWSSFGRKSWKLDRMNMALRYPGDPLIKPIASLVVSEKETVYVYPYAWVLIDRGGDDWEVARMD